MRANYPPITMLIASLVVFASLGSAVAAQPAIDATAGQLASYSAHDDHANVSMNESVRMHVNMHVDEDWTIHAAHEGEGTATVTIEAIEGSYEGEGTYEIDGEETVVLPVPEEPATLRITVENAHATHTLVVEFDEVTIECGEEFTVLRPVLVSAETTVDGEQVYAREYAEAGANPDLPEVPCDEHPNESVIDDPPSVNWSVEDGREAYNWSHEQVRDGYEQGQDDADDWYNWTRDEARETYENASDEGRDAYEETRDEARETDDEATHDAWRQYHEASDFARQVSEDAQDDAETVREDVEEDGERVANDARESATTVAEDANDTAEQVRSDVEDFADDGEEADGSAESETRASASASADASASYDDGSAEANADADADASAQSRTTVDSSHTPGLTADLSMVGQLKAQFGGQANA